MSLSRIIYWYIRVTEKPPFRLSTWTVTFTATLIQRNWKGRLEKGKFITGQKEDSTLLVTTALRKADCVWVGRRRSRPKGRSPIFSNGATLKFFITGQNEREETTQNTTVTKSAACASYKSNYVTYITATHACLKHAGAANNYRENCGILQTLSREAGTSGSRTWDSLVNSNTFFFVYWSIFDPISLIPVVCP